MAIIATASPAYVNGARRVTSYPVTFTENELRLAASEGVHRQVFHILRRTRDRAFTDESRYWQTTIEGALAELAVAKITRRYWAGAMAHYEPGMNGDDVDGQLQVRHTEYWTGKLRIEESDVDAWPYVLVCGHAPTMIVHGYMRAGEAKRHAEWFYLQNEKGKKAFWVPQSALHPLSELVEVFPDAGP